MCRASFPGRDPGNRRERDRARARPDCQPNYQRSEANTLPFRGPVWEGPVLLGPGPSLRGWERGAGAAKADTDSLYTTHQFESTDALGGLKLERKVSPPSYFHAPKLYMAGGKVKSKGFSHLTVEKFHELIGGDPIYVDRMLRLREMSRMHGFIKPMTGRIEKQLMLGKNRPKRRMLADGSSEPWDARETEEKWKE